MSARILGTGVGLVVIVGLAAGCVQSQRPYRHSRYDYRAFQSRVGLLPEPSYLPFVTHRERVPDGREAMVVCRWPDDAFPLRYHVESPVISAELQDEFYPRDPIEYVSAVERALERWQEVIGRPLRFVAVDDPQDASLRIHLQAEIVSEGDVRVLGLVQNSARQCRVVGVGDDPDRVEIEFEVPDAYLYIMDRVGLLTPRQVYAVALHEIGHALGASGQHSPLRGDLMYEVADDARIDTISEHDRNTFRALYRLPPGSVYAWLDPVRSEPVREIRMGPPRLDRPLRDERFGFSVSFPKGWQVIQSRRGWVAVDGLTWDYDASVQLIALRGTLDGFLEREGAALRRRGELAYSDVLEVDGARVARFTVRADDWTEETDVQEWHDGWLLLLIADCSARDYELYRPWFQRILLSLEREAPGPSVSSRP